MDTLLKTMPNLVRKYQASRISSCSFCNDRNGMLKSLSKEAERVAFGLFTNGFPTPTSLRLALAEGRLGEMTGFIPLVNRTWQILNDCGAHLLTAKIRKHQESVAAKAGPLAFHMMCDGYGGRKMVFGSDAESAVDFCVQMGWDYWCHRRDHKEEDVTIQHVTITTLPFIDICKGTEGHDWLPTVAQLKNLAAQTPTAPEFKWMSRDGKWKNVSPSHQGSRKQALDTPSSELLISPTDTVKDICRIMYQYHNRQAMEVLQQFLDGVEATHSADDDLLYPPHQIPRLRCPSTRDQYEDAEEEEDGGSASALRPTTSMKEEEQGAMRDVHP